MAYLSNYLIGRVGFGAEEWRWMLGVSGAPALFFLAMLFGIPRSPRWLAQKSRIDEARLVLQQIGEENVEGELQDIVQSIDVEHGHGQETLLQAKYRVPIFLAVSIGMFNQLSGINAILYYLNDIFAKAGFSKVSGDLQAVLIGFTNLCFTMLAMSIIDKRRPQNPVVDRRSRLLLHRLAALRRCSFHNSHEGLLGVAAGRIHRVFRVLPGRGHLGVSWRSVSHARPRQGPESGQFHALVYERRHLVDVSRSSPPNRAVRRLCSSQP